MNKDSCGLILFSSAMLWIALICTFITVIHGYCGPPPTLPNGMLKPVFTNHETYPIGSKVQYICRPGYVRIPGVGNFVICMVNSKWAPVFSEFCTKNFCIEPTLINGYISEGSPTDFVDGIVKGYNVGQTVHLKCSSLFLTMKGSEKITCGSDLTWNPAVPICEKRLGCSSPNILNGRVILRNKKEYIAEIDGYAFANGDTIQIMCDPGFRMHGSETSKCDYKWMRASYNWTPELPICKPATK